MGFHHPRHLDAVKWILWGTLTLYFEQRNACLSGKLPVIFFGRAKKTWMNHNWSVKYTLDLTYVTRKHQKISLLHRITAYQNQIVLKENHLESLFISGLSPYCFYNCLSVCNCMIKYVFALQVQICAANRSSNDGSLLIYSMWSLTFVACRKETISRNPVGHTRIFWTLGLPARLSERSRDGESKQNH